MQRLTVHGSVVSGRSTWAAQAARRAVRARRPRPARAPEPPVERVDFEKDAHLVSGPPDAATTSSDIVRRRDLVARRRALAGRRRRHVIEPPATSVALDDPDVPRSRRGRAVRERRSDDPDAFLRRFLAAVGSSFDPPSRSRRPRAGARALMVERGPWERRFHWQRLPPRTSRSSSCPGAHPAFDAICDALERELPAERLVLPGFGHTAAPPEFNAALIDFVERRFA